MKRYIKNAVLAGFMCMTALTGRTQNFRSSYFLEGAALRHRINPAFVGERNYISIPVLGNIHFAARGNVGMSDFIYKYDDPEGKYDLTTFMSSSVGKDEFLGNLHDKNIVDLNLDLTLLAFGFRGWGGFNTFDVEWRTNATYSIPYELFDFMKTGAGSADGTGYHIRNIRATGAGYAQVAVGHARRIGDKFTAGVKLKYLMGAAAFDARISRMDIYMSQDKWEVTANGSLDVSVSGAKFKTKNEEKGNKIKDLDVDDPRPGGWGLGLDLGTTYAVTDRLTVSAAVVDLGFISWKHTLKGKTLNDTYIFDGFKDIAVESDDPDDPNDLDEQLDDLADDLEDLAKFYDQGTVSKKKTMPGTTVHLGVEYKMPFYDRLSAGMLASTRFSQAFTWTEGRLYANIAPVKWFDCSVNYGLSNLASSLGWVVNFHPRGFNFFIGSDHMVMKVNGQYVPINDLNAALCMGLVVML
ncbi:MAG: DUF5723 family protein [Mangrovibacterium sp.]